MNDEEFRDGFMFALVVTQSMGHEVKFDGLISQLVCVAKGEVTLQPSPDEAIRSIEADVGKPLPDILKQSVHRMLNDRKQSDASSRLSARRLLNMMGVDPDEATS